MNKQLRKFTINEGNKMFYDKHFINSGRDIDENGNGTYIRNEDGSFIPATSLNDDPDIQYYGAVVNLIQECVKDRDYKLFSKHAFPEDFDLVDHFSKDYISLYDVVCILDDFNNPTCFSVFKEVINGEAIFEYLGMNDSIRKYVVKIPPQSKMWCDNGDELQKFSEG